MASKPAWTSERLTLIGLLSWPEREPVYGDALYDLGRGFQALCRVEVERRGRRDGACIVEVVTSAILACYREEFAAFVSGNLYRAVARPLRDRFGLGEDDEGLRELAFACFGAAHDACPDDRRYEDGEPVAAASWRVANGAGDAYIVTVQVRYLECPPIVLAPTL